MGWTWTSMSPPLRPSESSASSYAAAFHNHTKIVQSHLKGQLFDDAPLLPSYLPPTSYWSTTEKDLFFHGLSLYSRLRPDLIAAHIKTKNTIEVSLYLRSLHSAASEHSLPASELSRREMIPAAMEMSEKWIKYEEMLADRVERDQSCSWRVADDDGESHCTCPAIAIGIADTLPKTNAYLNHLDSICLMTQESIIRESAIKSQDLELQTHIASVKANICAGPSISNLDNSEDRASGNVATITLQSIVADDASLVNDKALQRRLKKRLYMRRKRAEKNGKPMDPISLRLRPGRERKSRKPSKPRPKKYNTKNKVELDPDDTEASYEPHSKGGTTKPYRIKKVFQDGDIDAQALSAMGLDFFHLSTLARWLRLFSSINDSQSTLDTVSISTHTIQLLADVTKEFVSEIVRRAVITKEQEIRMKRKMPVWKYERDEITVENVAECLYSMGLGHLDKEKYFETLLGLSEGLTRAGRNNCDTSVDEASQRDQDHSLKLSKDQLFRTPQHTLPESMLWCSLPSHREIYSSDDIMADEDDNPFGEVDQDADQDEDALNYKDEQLSSQYEHSLWNANI